MATRSASWSDNEVKALIAEWSEEKIQEELEGSTAENDENNDTGEDATIPTSDAASAPDTSASTKKENEAHEAQKLQIKKKKEGKEKRCSTTLEWAVGGIMEQFIKYQEESEIRMLNWEEQWMKMEIEKEEKQLKEERKHEERMFDMLAKVMSTPACVLPMYNPHPGYSATCDATHDPYDM